MEKKYFKGYDDENIPYLYFESSRKDINNNIVIFHGMTEPVDRYEEFGKFLATNGYNVYIPEIRGHGELKKTEIGDFGKKGINGIFDDMRIFFNELYEKNVNKNNTVLFGHSLGALIATKSMIEMKYKKLIISGIPLEKKFRTTLGLIATYLERALFFRKNSFFNKVLKKVNENFEPTKTEYDWLTRDENEVKKYVENEYCGYPVTPRFFTENFKLMKYVNKNYKKIQKESRILSIYGSEDKIVKVSHMDKIFEKLRKKKIKINVLENKKGRHESLNEINKYKIYDEILRWLNENKI